MFFPEFLLKLSERDAQVTWLDPFFDYRTTSGTTASLFLDTPRVPDGRALIVNHSVGYGQPGGAEFGIWTYIAILDAQNTTRGILDGKFERAGGGAGAALNGLTAALRSPVLLLPGMLLRYMFVKSAAVTSATIEFSTSGILIPIGNIQRV